MRLTSDIYLIGSGAFGFGFSDDLDCHIYALDAGGELTLIDAGGGRDQERLLANMRDDGLDPAKARRVILTHGHADHAGGAAGLASRLDVEVLAPAEAVAWIRDADEAAVSLSKAREAGLYPADYRLTPCPIGGALIDGAEIAIGPQHRVRIIETPGHARGHISALVEGPYGRYLFAGDAVFFGGQVLIEPTYDASPSQLKDSLERLAQIDFEAFFPGHLSFSLRDGRRHVDAAVRSFRQFLLPRNLL